MFKFKKTIVAVILVLLMSLIFSGCMYSVSITGIKSFDKNDSEKSINLYMLPSDDFLEEFENTTAVYNYDDFNRHLFFKAITEHSIVALNYEEDVYKEAKAYCLENMDLSEVNKFEYNGYTFIENIALLRALGKVKDGVNKKYPYYFNMFAYNDDECCLVFMGFYNSRVNHDMSAYLAKTDWGAFLDTYYTQYYDFGTKEETKLEP